MYNKVDESEHGASHRTFDPTDIEPETAVIAMVADLDEKEPTELSPLYSAVDDAISSIFSNPPASEAQVSITFTYENYRITIQQNGETKFVKLG